VAAETPDKTKDRPWRTPNPVRLVRQSRENIVEKRGNAAANYPRDADAKSL
jgi:hypothetical protein